jgi:putative tricarboxylic transport membrane protein
MMCQTVVTQNNQMEARHYMRKSSLCTTIFWVALGVFVSAYAYIKLGIGKFNAPGPGLMPFLLGVLFGLLALYKLVMTLLGHGESEEPPKEVDEADQSPTLYKKLALVVVALLAYAILLEPLGFLPTTFLTMVFLFRSAGFKRWSIAAASSAGVVLITYFLFTYLGVRFPPGILRALGLN